jgi:FlaA1/EpsC-like NDP-sugar epimerase
MYEPSEFMRHLGGFVKDGQHMIFSVPDLKSWLKRNFTNCINFEHTVFLTEPYVEYLLAKHGFRVVEKKYVMDGHSIFYATVRDATVKPIELEVGLYQENLSIYENFINYHKELINDLNQKMRDSAQPLYLFGAHVFAQFLIAMGLNTEKIVCLLDNDKNKQGRRLYGTKLNVASPKVLAEVKDPIVILKAGVYNDEIKKDILDNINKTTVFFE